MERRSPWADYPPDECFKLIYCFYIYAAGFYIRKHGINKQLANHGILLPTLTAMIFAGSFAFKLILVKWPATMPLQFLTQFMVAAFAFGALLCGLSFESTYLKLINRRLRDVITMFSAISLEMYLVQFPVISLSTALPFPANVLVVLVVTIVLAFILHTIDERIFHAADRALSAAANKT